MNKVFFPAIAVLAIIFLTSVVLLSARRNKTLVKEKEALILQNDSLHMLQLKTKDELESIQNSFDSISKKNKKSFTFK